MSAIVRDLKEDVIRLNCKLKLSNFVPPPIEDIIKTNVPDDHYIVGVTYRQGDSQICMSGHIKEGEKVEEACIREMSEELFLIPRSIPVSQDSKMIGDGSLRKILETKVNNFFMISLGDTKIQPREVFDDVEDTHRRVVICVHGSEFDILRYMKRIRKQEYINDGIVSVWAARKKNVLGAIYSIRANRRGINYLY